MLPREHRYPFFQGVPEKNYSTRFFHLRYRSRDEDGLRVAIVVGKRVDKLAHSRNRVRRVFSEVLSETISDWSLPYDLVFYLRKSLLEVERDEIASQLKSTFSRIGIVQ